MRKLLLCVLAGLLFVSCSDRPEMVVDDETMVDLLVDIHHGDAYLTTGSATFSSDSAKKVLRQAILKRHGVTEEQFDSSLNWYGRNIDHYVELYVEVEKKLEARLADARERGEESGEMIAQSSKDEQNLWTAAPIRRISKFDDVHSLSFQLTEEDGLIKGDRVYWQFKKSNISSQIQMLMAVEYDNGCSSYITRSYTKSSSTCKMTLQTDSCLVPKRVYGYVHFFPEENEIIFIDSIRVEKMPFVESNYHQILSQRKFDPKETLIRLREEKEAAANDSADTSSAIDAPIDPNQSKPLIGDPPTESMKTVSAPNLKMKASVSQR